MNRRVLEEEPFIRRTDFTPYQGVRGYNERKKFFYSIKGHDIKVDEVKRCERRHTLLVGYNCMITLAYIYVFSKLSDCSN